MDAFDERVPIFSNLHAARAKILGLSPPASTARERTGELAVLKAIGADQFLAVVRLSTKGPFCRRCRGLGVAPDRSERRRSWTMS
jgi:hypothetical protein